ncbi:MAG TPA: tryptophan--tRNA ligase, partial [Oligoflexia bacterium]|nr:tryptophan--tRNA ligase [Oligoflexia bacterium]
MLGNYLGAIRNWVDLQKKYDSLFCVVDLHAITIKQSPTELQDRTLSVAATYLACGVDPSLATVFVQSQVAAHAELSWILTCFSNMGELSRMTQFKDKSAKQKSIGTGLFTYPVLMAADILLYQTQLVPVGQDQKQHLELARDLAIRMNTQVGDPSDPLFVVPEPFIAPVGAKIMSLADPKAKMSKSDEDANATIFLTDSEDVIIKKLKKAVTDSGTDITYSEDKPGIKNLIDIQVAITGKNSDQIVSEFAGKQYGHLKLATAEIVAACIKPIREKTETFMKDKGALLGILNKGADKANERAQATLQKVKKAVGFVLSLALISLISGGCASVPATPEAQLGPMPTTGPVGSTFSKHGEKFVNCGRDAVTIQTGSTQRIDFRFTILPSGVVAKPRIDGMSSPDPDLHGCLLRALAKVQFPKPKDKKPKEIGYTITIRPE